MSADEAGDDLKVISGGGLLKREEATGSKHEQMRQAALFQKKINTYKTLMRRAGMKKEAKMHIDHLIDFDASERMPIGPVSLQLYDSLYGGRKFDRYGKMVSTKLSAKQQLLANLSNTLAGQVEGEGEAEEEDESKKQLKTSIFDVGYKKTTYGPPGLRVPMTRVLNSEGNEKFFSYDGPWRDGEMNGMGKYKWADGMVYVGDFKDGQPHGEGKAEYPGGSTYEGYWKDGRYDGPGKLEYASGITYEGEWRRGKRHGKGRLDYLSGNYYDGDFRFGLFEGRGEAVSEKTGFRFMGTWSKGFINGTGRVTWPSGKLDTREFMSLGGMTFFQLIEHLKHELELDCEEKTEMRDSMYSVKMAIKLQDHVDAVRSELKEDRREAKEVEAEKRRARDREMRENQRQNRLKALADSADARANGDGD